MAHLVGQGELAAQGVLVVEQHEGVEALRKKVLGLEELHTYDLYTSMLPEADQPVSFQQAREEVLEATRVLGEEYHRVLASSFDQRWMDIRENEGKRSGAYSCGCRVHPFVLLNHKDKEAGGVLVDVEAAVEVGDAGPLQGDLRVRRHVGAVVGLVDVQVDLAPWPTRWATPCTPT